MGYTDSIQLKLHRWRHQDCGSSVFTAFPPDGVTSGAYAYTSDYGFGSLWQIGVTEAAQVGEQFTWVVTYPDGTTQTIGTLTYDGTNSHGSGCWSDSSGSWYCNPLTPGAIFNYGWAVFLGCANQHSAPGQWTMAVYDNGALATQLNPDGTTTTWQPVPFTVSHGGELSITSPTDNELFDLNANSYTATGSVPFAAGTTTGNAISWTAALSYNTSQGYGYYTENRPFSTASGQEHDETYQSDGGRVKTTAQTTAPDGSTVQDCVTFYVEGTQSFDPTNQLLGLYTTGATPHLMTGLAHHESTYWQFFPQNLLGMSALWPHESNDGGSHIGLMMPPITQPLAWDWLQNTDHGVNSTVDGFVGAKLPMAQSFVNWLTGAKSNKNVPVHKGLQAFSSPSAQLEDMALVLYRGNAASAGWAGQYYIPVCPPPGTITAKGNTWTCSGASWYWAANDPNLNDPGADQNVQAKYIFPSGSGTFGNRAGLQYVRNSSSDPWYDSSQQGGVRNEMH